jgi:hypothetical protein
MLVERNRSATAHPKMDITNVRSMELFRRLGLTRVLRAVAVPETHPFDVAWITTMVGHELHRFRYPNHDRRARYDAPKAYAAPTLRAVTAAPVACRTALASPLEPAMRVSQVLIEPALRRVVEAPQLLVRPDQHVAWRGWEAGAEAGAIIARCLGWG